MIHWLDDTFSYWEKIVIDNCILSDDIVIVHVAKDYSFLSVLLDIFARVHDKYLWRNVHIITDKDIQINSDVFVLDFCNIVLYPTEKINDIAKLYGLYPFFERLFFDSYAPVLDYDITMLRGVNGISDYEIASIAVFDRPEFLSLSKFQERKFKHESGFVDWEGLRLGLRYAMYSSFEEILEEMKHKCIEKNSEIVLFGTTITAKKVIRSLDGYNVIAVIDNDANLEGENIEGISIHTPDFLNKMAKEKVLIIVVSRHYRLICEQLSAMGYKTGKQVFIVHDAVFRELPRFLIKKDLACKLVNGEKIFLELKKHFPGKMFYINPHTGTGDVYFSWLYLCKRICENEFVLLVPTESCRKIASLMGMFAVIISADDLSALAVYGRYIGLKKLGIKILNYAFEQYVNERIRGCKGLDYNTMLQKLVFNSQNRASAKRIPQKCSDYIFSKYKMIKGHSVLLSPYAGHALSISWEFWIRLASFLKERGYCVCTNICGEEKAIEGTEGIFLDYSEVLDFSDRAGIFIGLRSGLCDILSPTTAKMVILYPDQIFSKVVDYYNYFSLVKMGMRKDNLLEIVWKNEGTDRYIEEIEQFICD